VSHRNQQGVSCSLAHCDVVREIRGTGIRAKIGAPDALLHKESGHQAITSEYIRLLPFGKTQVDEFFSKPFNLSNYNHDNLVASYVDSLDIRKPLFFWMFTLLAKSGIFNQSKIRKLALSDDRDI
jgi:hypothetical protein